MGGAAYMVRATNTAINIGTVLDAGWDNRELPMIEIVEVNNLNNATNFTFAAAFSETTAADVDGDGLANTNEWLVGTDPFHPDSDRDGIPDGWEVANSLNPLNGNDAGLDTDLDGMTARQEYLAGTAPGNAASVFTIAQAEPVGPFALINHSVQSGRVYTIRFADSAGPTGWNWQPFANTNAPYGRYTHAAAPGHHTFTDTYNTATSGHLPTNNLRLYAIEATLP
jgi:hypothetical protein